MTTRPRAADDFDMIRKRMQEIQTNKPDPSVSLSDEAEEMEEDNGDPSTSGVDFWLRNSTSTGKPILEAESNRAYDRADQGGWTSDDGRTYRKLSAKTIDKLRAEGYTIKRK